MTEPVYLDDNDPMLDGLMPPANPTAPTNSAHYAPTDHNPIYLDDNDPILQGMSKPEGPELPRHGSILPISTDEAGNPHFDINAGITGNIIKAVKGPGDYMDKVSAGMNPLSEEGQSMARDTAMSAAGVEGPAAEGLEAGMSAMADKTTSALGAGKDLIQPVKSTISNDLKPLADQHYADARTSGGELPPSAVNEWLDKIKQYGQKKSILGKSDVNTYIQAAENNLRDKSLPITDLIDYDQELGDLTYDSKGSDSKAYHNIQDHLREIADKHASLDTTDAEAAGGVWSHQDALKSWSQGRKLDDLDKLASRAEASPTPATVIQSGVRTMKGNPARTLGYSADEKAALDEAGRTGKLTALAKFAGNRLSPLVTAGAGYLTGGLGDSMLAAGAHSMINESANNVAGNLQMRKLNELARRIRENGKGGVE